METYITRQQVRGVNKKLFAYDLIYNDNNSNINTINYLITHVIMSDDTTETMSDVPIILELNSKSIKENINSIRLLETSSVIIQIDNATINDVDCINEVSMLKSEGYRFIVKIDKTDDNIMRAIVIADFMKFDINDIPEIINKKRISLKCKFICSNVNSREAFVKAEEFNTDYYEGTYIDVEKHLDIEDNSHSKINFIELIAKIGRENITIDEIADIIKRDALISSQIIKLANSAYFAGRTKTDEVRSAVIRVGLNNIKRWIFIIQCSLNKDISEELLRCSYMRALLSERVIKQTKKLMLDKDKAYMIGLFSMLDILTGKPMESSISSMELGQEVEDALLYREGEGGQLINLITAYEEANWKRVDKYVNTFGVNKDKLFKLYFDSLEEVENLWSLLSSSTTA